MDKSRYVVYNPNGVDVSDLPVIYGFNNGGRTGLLMAQLIAEDGTPLGGHCCSSEGFMYGDLGILEGYRKDRHKSFRKHYPGGYRMDFVPYTDAETHEGLQGAFRANDKLADQVEATQ